MKQGRRVDETKRRSEKQNETRFCLWPCSTRPQNNLLLPSHHLFARSMSVGCKGVERGERFWDKGGMREKKGKRDATTEATTRPSNASLTENSGWRLKIGGSGMNEGREVLAGGREGKGMKDRIKGRKRRARPRLDPPTASSTEP